MLLSFITPTFNRKNLLSQTLDSILSSNIKETYEIIVIDDGSNDQTKSSLKENGYLDKIRYFYLEKNIGATGAKNFGANKAIGDWLVFLDSDDLLIYSKDFLNEIKNAKTDLIMFRCIDFDENLVGKDIGEQIIDLKFYKKNGFPGECLSVIKKQTFLQFPYIENLRGSEHLAYIKMLKNGHIIKISRVIARRYRTQNEDRLSHFNARFKRSEKIYESFKIEAKEIGLNFKLSLRIIKYFLLKNLKFLKGKK